MAFRAHRLEIEAVEPQVVIVLKIVDRGDVMGILEPSDIVRTRIFPD